ncbi:MAG: GAF and ANTAR domain-containing protein [Dermatophilaceae bacterium]
MDESQARIAFVNELIDREPTPADSASAMGGRLHRLCCALARVLPAQGAAVNLITEDHSGGGVAAASGPSSHHLAELQFTLAEGPARDAFEARRPVLEPDLLGRGVRRWPAYAPAASQHGVRAVFAFPLQVGAARLGSLDMFCQQPGSLSTHAVSQSVTFSEVALITLLEAPHLTEDGHSAGGLDAMLAYRSEIYQAQGVVMVELGVSLTEAMLRLRAHAYASERDLSDVARDVVTGRLVLDRDAR